MTTQPTLDVFQFQGKTEPPFSAFGPIIQFESWHSPLSEPVRFKIVPQLRVALIASGLFAPVLNPETQLIQFFESRWHQPWSEPVRVKLRLRTGANQFSSSFFDNTPNPSNQLQGWYNWFENPVWPKKGLKSYLQQTLAYHPRYLPPPNVTIRISAIETNSDAADFDVWVYDELPVPIDLTAVDVSISEVIVDGSGAISSIKETE